MGQFLIRRLLGALLNVFVASLMCFLLLFVLMPGDPAARIAGKNRTPELIAQINQMYHFNSPWPVQYFVMMKQIVTGKITSFTQTGLKVDPFVLHALPVTFSLAVVAAAMWLTVGILVGIRGAKNPGSRFDKFSMVAALIGLSLPAAWLAIELLGFLTSSVKIFPPGGYETIVDGGIFGWFFHLILPALSLAIMSAGVYARMSRTTITQTLREEYVKTATSKGLDERHVFVKHVLRTALIPIVVMFGLDFGVLLSGAIFTESVFGLPGLGMVMMNAIKNFDASVLMVGTIIGAAFIVCGNICADLVQAMLDPRVRIS